MSLCTQGAEVVSFELKSQFECIRVPLHTLVTKLVNLVEGALKERLIAFIVAFVMHLSAFGVESMF